MASIIIREKNIESYALNTDFTDIVYIPGFGDASIDMKELDENRNRKINRTKVPTYVQNLETFKTLFGNSPQPLGVDMTYDKFPDEAAPSGESEPIDREITETFTGRDLDDTHKIITLTHDIKADTDIVVKINDVVLPEVKPGTEPEEYNYTFEGDTVTLTDAISHEDIIKVTYTYVGIAGLLAAAGEPDRAYIYACEVLSAGLPIYYERINDIGDIIDPNALYSYLEDDEMLKLQDRGTYRIKYFTTGGYPSFEYDDNKILKTFDKILTEKVTDGTSEESATQTGRVDAVFLVDHTNNPDRDLTGSDSVFGKMQTQGVYTKENIGGSYATLFTPWVDTLFANSYEYNKTENEKVTINAFPMPASLLFLINTGIAVHNSSYWNSIAGVTRGVVEDRVKEILTRKPLTATIANKYQVEGLDDLKNPLIAINAITNVYPYGQTIMGIRTLQPVSKVDGQGNGIINASHILNLRLVVCDLKKRIYQAAKTLLFEQNSEVLWAKFQSLVLPLLELMKANNAIEKYALVKVRSTNKRELKATLEIVPVYPVEKFDITIQITDELTNVEEA